MVAEIFLRDWGGETVLLVNETGHFERADGFEVEGAFGEDADKKEGEPDGGGEEGEESS